MTVFKTFWKILNKNKLMVFIYTIILLVFGISNMQTSEQNLNFVADKPDILIVNNDTDNKITQNLIQYLSQNTNIKEIKNNEDAINDSLFYREVNYVIYIPKNYGTNFLKGDNPEIEIKSTGDYQASLAEMLITRYLEVANIYQKSYNDENLLINKINNTLAKQTSVEITSTLDSSNLEKAAYYYNFSSYSILACLIFIIGVILYSFNEEKIRKRTIISNTDYKKHNRILLLSNCCYALILWLLYVIISFVIIGKIMWTPHGLLLICNSLILTITATTIAFFIGNVITNKDALGGLVNVVALGSSFLCGVFVPMDFLPNSVIKIAHILPTYYYVVNNNTIITIEEFTFSTLKPIVTNVIIMLLFALLFILLTNLVTRRKRKIG